MTVYKVDIVNEHKVVEFTSADMACKYVKDNSYEIYTVYCRGLDVVVIEVV